MTVATSQNEEFCANPIDLIEEIANAHDWMFERKSEEEMAVEISGEWSDYRLFFSWLEDLYALHFACAFETRVPDRKRREINELLATVNEKMAVGHFDLWVKEGMLVFRHSTLLRGGQGASVEQLEDLVSIAVTESERFFPAFQYVVWGGKAPAEAVTMAILDTVGEA
jgi:hypothetical protein